MSDVSIPGLLLATSRSSSTTKKAEIVLSLKYSPLYFVYKQSNLYQLQRGNYMRKYGILKSSINARQKFKLISLFIWTPGLLKIYYCPST
jgi:hypothetical protein